MLFAGWEIRMVKNCDRGQHFQAVKLQMKYKYVQIVLVLVEALVVDGNTSCL